jgi:hypothetical protein
MLIDNFSVSVIESSYLSVHCDNERRKFLRAGFYLTLLLVALKFIEQLPNSLAGLMTTPLCYGERRQNLFYYPRPKILRHP